MNIKQMSIGDKIWLSVAALSFVVISSTFIAYSLGDGAYADDSSTESNQLNTPTQSSTPGSKATSLTAPKTEVADKNQRFLSGLESSVSSETKALLKEIPDSQKIMAGEKICQALAQGITFNDIAVAFIQKYGTNPTYTEYAGALIGASVGTYCPEYADKVPSRQ
jgi:hypothetical protein